MAGVYEINNLSELQAMSSHLADRCVLMADIDASETAGWNFSGGEYAGFIPVGTAGSPFVGSFIGNGHTISNLYSNPASGLVGLFGSISSISNGITNGTFTGNANNWSLGTGWAYSSNTVVKNADGTGLLSQAAGDMVENPVIGEKYRLSFKISGWAAGSVTPTCGGTELTSAGTDDTFTIDFTATTADGLSFLPTETSRFTIDDITLVRIREFSECEIKDFSYSVRSATIGSGGFAALLTSASDARSIVKNLVSNGQIVHTETNYSLDCGGLFGAIQHSDIEDCNATVNISVVWGSGYYGCICGEDVNCTWEDCFSSGSITRTGEDNNNAYPPICGGFIGKAGTSSTYTKCYSTAGIVDNQLIASVVTGYSRFGGFVGECDSGATFTLCYASGSIIALRNNRVTIGGFSGTSGIFSKCFATGEIICPTPKSTSSLKSAIGGFCVTSGSASSNCYARGDVCKSGAAGTDTRIGGFIALLSANLTNCYCANYVHRTAGQSHGGFVGSYSSGTITSCYWDTDVSETTISAGSGTPSGITGKTTEEMKVQATFVGWDFTDIWEIRQFERGAVGASNVTVWLSRSADYDRFDGGTKDTDSFEITVPTANDIQWLAALESLLLGTAGDEWQITSNKLETPLSPTNFKIRQQSEYGSGRIQPTRVNASLMFVDFVARKLREMTFDGGQEKYVSPDLCSLAEHITASGITSIARQKNPDSIIWCTLGDGSLISMTYEREQDVVAWAKHPIGGFVQSVAVLPGATEDVVYISVEREINGADKVFLEKLAPRTFNSVDEVVFSDCAVRFEAAALTPQITGLTHLIGETVSIIADGVRVDDATVGQYEGDRIFYGSDRVVYGSDEVFDTEYTAFGSVLSKIGDTEIPCLKAVVGLPYTATLQPMRLTIGDSMGSNIRISELVISFYNTGTAKYGLSETELFDIDFTDARWSNKSDISGLFTGEVVVSMPGGFDPQTPIYVVSDGPLPCVVRAIIPRIERTGR